VEQTRWQWTCGALVNHRYIVSIFADDAALSKAFADRIDQLVQDEFDKWPERRIGLHSTIVAFPDLSEHSSAEGDSRG
jgi:hypothetical protein